MNYLLTLKTLIHTIVKIIKLQNQYRIYKVANTSTWHFDIIDRLSIIPIFKNSGLQSNKWLRNSFNYLYTKLTSYDFLNSNNLSKIYSSNFTHNYSLSIIDNKSY